jgi:hypothetical protein
MYIAVSIHQILANIRDGHTVFSTKYDSVIPSVKLTGVDGGTRMMLPRCHVYANT